MSKVEATRTFKFQVIRKILDMAGYYRKFCENFSVVAIPLKNLLKKNVPYVWSSVCQQAFGRVKAEKYV